MLKFIVSFSSECSPHFTHSLASIELNVCVTCARACVCACEMYFSNLRVGLVNTGCFRIILKLRSVRLLPRMLHRCSLLLTFGCLSKQGGTLELSQKPSLCGCRMLHVDIKRVCQSVHLSAHVSVWLVHLIS